MELELVLENPLFLLTLAVYTAAGALYAAAWRSVRPLIGKLATWLLLLAAAGNVTLIVSRWVEAGRPPFKSLFESLVFLALCIAVVYLALERLYRTRIFGAVAALGSAGALAVALFKWDAEIVKLPPALQSGWFIPHVVVYFGGYAALFVATVVSVVQLARPNLRLSAGSVLSGRPIALDQAAYDSIRFGFTLLTLGLFIGSIWAKSAWGDYWMWDPKENWSLVTWLFFGSYLHLHKVYGWQGRRAAWLVIAGFAIVLFTYLGMSMLPTAAESEHVYQG